MVSAGIIITGDEVLSGKSEERNFKWLSKELQKLGIKVKRCVIVGDEKEAIKEALKGLESKCDIVLITGGLGPTSDDITSESASEFLDRPLELNPIALKQVEAFWKRMGRPMPEKAKKQAFLPFGSSVISNPIGSAPGFYIKHKTTFYFFLPGVPGEVKSIFNESIKPILIREFGLEITQREVCIVTFGIIESKIMEHLKDFERLYSGVKISYRIKFPEVLLYLSTDTENIETLNASVKWVEQKLSNKIVSLNGESMPYVVGKLLRNGNFTLAVAESCTGGLISHLITNVPGSSYYFLTGCVTYSNAAKKRILGVKDTTLKDVGAVHEKTAEEMASGVKDITGADFGLATTGIAGPTGGTKEKPVGTICIGLATPSYVKSYKYQFNFNDRLLHKKIFAFTALDILRKALLIRKGKPPFPV